MSALKHGLFRSGFMLCDRCVSNAKCEQFKPGNHCVLEQETFDKAVTEMIDEYNLDNVADRILAERAAMYLIRIIRAESYEAAVGQNEQTAYWDTYIGRLDSMMRALFNDLAISRGKRLKLEKGDGLLVSLDEVIRKFTISNKKEIQLTNQTTKMRSFTAESARNELWFLWQEEYPKLKAILKRRKKVESEKK